MPLRFFEVQHHFALSFLSTKNILILFKANVLFVQILNFKSESLLWMHQSHFVAGNDKTNHEVINNIGHAFYRIIKVICSSELKGGKDGNSSFPIKNRQLNNPSQKQELHFPVYNLEGQ